MDLHDVPGQASVPRMAVRHRVNGIPYLLPECCAARLCLVETASSPRMTPERSRCPCRHSGESARAENSPTITTRNSHLRKTGRSALEPSLADFASPTSFLVKHLRQHNRQTTRSVREVGLASRRDLQLRKLVLPPARHVRDFEELVAVLAEGRAADIVADGPCAPLLRGTGRADLAAVGKGGIDADRGAGAAVLR